MWKGFKYSCMSIYYNTEFMTGVLSCMESETGVSVNTVKFDNQHR